VKTIARALAWVAALVLVAAAAGLSWFWNTAYRDRSAPSVETHVIVDRGSTFGEVARKLASEGVIDNVLAFRILARLRHVESDAHAGEYRFPPNQTQDEVLKALVSGGAQVAAWVTIPEGFTAAQIARRLDDAGIGSAVQLESAFRRDTLVLDGTRTKSMEGYLFPSTYLMPLGAGPKQIEAVMTGQFFKELPADARRQARALKVTLPQAVTVASLVEREAKADADRPLIAGVIYNRLRLGMPLEVDATIEYALPRHKSELSFGDLKIDSPYNTYAHSGLPPTPIANPGKASLEAALHPSKSDFLYYVYCGNGRHVFSRTFEQHQANVARCLH
jgi:UPF0755 protein